MASLLIRPRLALVRQPISLGRAQSPAQAHLRARAGTLLAGSRFSSKPPFSSASSSSSSPSSSSSSYSPSPSAPPLSSTDSSSLPLDNPHADSPNPNANADGTARPRGRRFLMLASATAALGVGIGLVGSEFTFGQKAHAEEKLRIQDRKKSSFSLAQSSLGGEATETETEPTSASSPSSLLSSLPISTLLRTYFVFTLCSLPIIIDYSPSLLHSATNEVASWTGIPALTLWVVRNTFFAQFVGGETVEGCLPLMEEMRKRGVGTMLSYSVEADEHENDGGNGGEVVVLGLDQAQRNADAHIRETLRAIEVAGEFEKRMRSNAGANANGTASTDVGAGTWVAVKVTGLTADPELLHRASNTLVRLRQPRFTTRSAVTNTKKGADSDTDTPVHYPGTPTSLDLQVLDRPACYDGRTLEMLPKSAAGVGGVLDGEEGIRRGDLDELRKLAGVLRDIARKAEEHRIRIVIDAEHSWYQPALDGYTLMLSQEFNKVDKRHSSGAGTESPLVFGTFQAYLQRNPEHLASTLAHARANGYTLGVKLVRGAYHEQERNRWKKEGRYTFGSDPVWSDKQGTDAAYDGSIDVIIDQVAEDVQSGKHPSVAVLFGTHNRHSCELVIQKLKERGLLLDDKRWASNSLDGKVMIAQLYGMSDDLTDRVTEQLPIGGSPSTLKYLPYGNLEEVMPYLGRRAVENKSMLSGTEGAGTERRRVWREMTRRLGM